MNFRVTNIKVWRYKGKGAVKHTQDELCIYTNLPMPSNEDGDGDGVVEINLKYGTAEEYCSKYYQGVPVEIIPFTY